MWPAQPALAYATGAFGTGRTKYNALLIDYILRLSSSYPEILIRNMIKLQPYRIKISA